MNSQVKGTYKEIKNLEIQGATAVALAAVNAVSGIEQKEELEEAINLLKKSRPTEPLMRNGLRYVERKFEQV